MNTMQEFLLWSNCTNSCKFCWQQKIHDTTTFLNEKEMIESINAAYNKLDEFNNGDDVLLVGGEILANYYDSVSESLQKLLIKCIKLVKQKRIRFLYINTNLLYEDKRNLEFLFKEIQGFEDRLKFTTSFDIYGRFIYNEKDRTELFQKNLEFIHKKYPKINIVLNSIITKQLANCFDYESFSSLFNRIKKEYGIKHINFIPYIPVKDDKSMNVTFKDIVRVLAFAEKMYPGYINFYINDLDFNQNKKLYEYHKDIGYIECTSNYLKCHHNENFKKVLSTEECYICKLKEVFR